MKQELKNKILLAIICIFTLFVLFFALRISEKGNDEKLNDSVISKYLSEVKYEGINDFVLEYPNIIIYVSNSKNNESRKFEKKLAKIIKKYNLENEMIYININNLNIVDPIYQNAPQFIFYNNGNVSEIVNCSILNTKADIINILKERSVIYD